MLISGNLYQNTAQLYDLDNRDIIKDDIIFYTDYANNINGDILEMACGTGRISLALLKNSNKNIDAFDLSSTMLEQFQTKLQQESDENQKKNHPSSS